MNGLLVAEAIKLRRRWVARVLTLVFVGLVALTAIVLLVVPKVAPEAIPELPSFNVRDGVILGIQQVVGQTWFPLILTVVMLGSEFKTSAWAAAVTRESRRVRHVAARWIAFGSTASLVGLAAIAGWTAVTFATSDGALGFSALDWLGVVWKVALVQFTWVAFGLAAIGFLRSTGVAIGLALAYSFLEGVLALWDPFAHIALANASTALIGTVESDVSAGFGVSFTLEMSFTHALVVVVGWAIGTASLAWLALVRKDA